MMKKSLFRGISLALALVLVLTVLPAMAPKAEAAVGDVSADNGVVFFEDNFDSYTSAANFKAAYPGSTFHSSATFSLVNDNGDQKLKVTASKNVNNPIKISGLDLPIRNSGRYQLGLKVEIGLSNVDTTGGVYLQLANDNNKCSYVNSSGVVTENVTQNGTNFTMKDMENGSRATSLSVSSGTNKVLTAYITAPNGYALQSFMFNFYLRGVSTVTVDFFRVSIVCGMGTNGWDDNTATGMLGYDNAYIKLQDDMTVSENKTMGTNAVIDLNGHNLTVADGCTLTGGVASQIVDTSANKTGRVICDKDSGLSLTNPDHPTVPIYDGTGYMFLDKPSIGLNAQYQFTATSADGFVLQFRPGFGVVNGVNIREEYLATGNSGIKMNLELAWVDALGATGKTAVAADSIFADMYSAADKCGQVSVEGLLEYRSIDLVITLEVLNGQVRLDPIPFTNDKLTIHFANDFSEACSLNNQTAQSMWSADAASKVTDGRLVFHGTSRWDMYTSIVTGAGKVLVMDFDYYFVDDNPNAVDLFAIGQRVDSSTMHALISMHNYGADGEFDLYATAKDAGNSSDANGVHIRVAIDLGTGLSMIKVGDNETITKTIPNVLTWLNNQTEIWFKTSNGIDKSFPVGAEAAVAGAYQFDNMLIYTYESGVEQN